MEQNDIAQYRVIRFVLCRQILNVSDREIYIWILVFRLLDHPLREVDAFDRCAEILADGRTLRWDDQRAATLVRNGSWYIMPAHPNRNRPKRPCEFDPKLEGKSAIEGGPLSNFENCHICGKDAQGNLYGYLYSWCGETILVAGHGPLRTKVYRLRKVAEGASR